MSAFVVSRDHINYLVQAADSRRVDSMMGETFRWWSFARGESTTLHAGHSTPDAASISRAGLGQLWWDENYRSYNHRYGESGGAPEFTFKHSPYVSLDPAQIIRACDCLAYQSCEHPGWRESEAKAALDALRSKAVRKLVDEDAERRGVTLQWEITDTAAVTA